MTFEEAFEKLSSLVGRECALLCTDLDAVPRPREVMSRKERESFKDMSDAFELRANENYCNNISRVSPRDVFPEITFQYSLFEDVS